MKLNYRHTLYACYFGYISQAITISFLPLLFVVLQKEYHLSVTQLGFMVSYIFVAQIVVDLFGAKYAERIGYRICAVAAHICCAGGLVCLSFLPDLLPDPYIGLLICATLYAAGSGLVEVLVSPLVQALPLERKESVMSLLHSFYSWGYAGVVLLTTGFFALAGIQNWRIAACLWAIIPAANTVLFLFVPLCTLTEEGQGMSIRELLHSRLFWLLALLMICSGASEHGMCQWASYFAEKGLQVSKTMGDLLGPCLFAVLMALCRVFYGIWGEKIPLQRFISFSGWLCIGSYLLAVFAPVPLLSLIGCGICGLSVGIMWPGMLSVSAQKCPQGGTAMFALLALAGDVGCSSGPFVVSTVADLFGGELKAGLLAAILFPLILVIGIRILRKNVRIAV